MSVGSTSSFSSSSGFDAPHGVPLQPVLTDNSSLSSQASSLEESTEDKALRRYSHSIKNFTYHLFENFRKEVEARNAAGGKGGGQQQQEHGARSHRRKQRKVDPSGAVVM